MTNAPDKIKVMRQSSYFMTFEVATTVFMIETAYALIFLSSFLLNLGSESMKIFVLVLWALHAVKFFILVFYLMQILTRYLSGSYLITSKHLYVQRGILEADEEIYDLDQIRSVSLHQSWWGRRFHYGTIRLKMGARGLEKELEFSAISNPHKYTRIFKKHTNEYPLS